MIGRDHGPEEIRTFRVSRIRGEIRFATRRERDFRLPPEFNAQEHRPPPAWQMGEIVGEARIELVGRHRLVGGADAPALRAPRGRRLRHPVREPRAPRGLGAPPRRARGAARARRAAARGGRQPEAGARAPRRRAAEGRRRRAGRGRAAGRASRRPGRARALRATAGAARVPPRRVRRGARRR